MYDHAGCFVDPSALDPALLKSIIASINPSGKLDVVLSPAPATIDEAERALAEVFTLAPSRISELDLTVFLTAERRSQWQHTFGHEADSDPSRLKQFDCVAVGGTWDHMHPGHRLMLTMAAIIAKTKVIIGVTGQELLVNKKYRAALQSIEVRERSATSFVKMLRPDLAVVTSEMHDMYGPTATERDMQALVVSLESASGGALVNEKRIELGFSEVEIIVVGLIGGSDKVSSTDLRREELESE